MWGGLSSWGHPSLMHPARDVIETFVLCQVLPAKAVLLQCLHLQAAADYLGLFILLLSQELNKEEIVDHYYQDFFLVCCFWFNKRICPVVLFCFSASITLPKLSQVIS